MVRKAWGASAVDDFYSVHRMGEQPAIALLLPGASAAAREGSSKALVSIVDRLQAGNRSFV